MEKSGIYQELHRVTDLAATGWATVYPIISSTEALKLYTVVILALITAYAGLIAYDAKRKLTTLKAAKIDFKFPGPDPKKEDSIEKRKAVLEARAEEELNQFRPALCKLLLCGLIIPTITFVTTVISYSWFDPSGFPFMNLADKSLMHSVDNSTLVYFTINQIGHGALFDMLEVFNRNFTLVANNPHNYYFSGIVLIYRTIISGFIVALTIGWGQFFLVKRSFREEIRLEIERFRRTPLPLATNAATDHLRLAA